MDRAPGRFLTVWVGAAIAAVTALALSSDLDTLDLGLLLALVAIIALAELIVIDIDVGRAGAVFSLSEAAITASFLLIDPLPVVVASSLAALVAHLPRRLSLDKVLFNVSQVTVATSAAGITLLALPGLGPVVGERPVAAVVLAMGVYALANTLAFRSLVARVAGPTGLTEFDQQVPLTLASMLGTVAVGIVAAALWTTSPPLIPLLLVPIVAIQLAARSSLRAAELVRSLRSERDRLDQVVQGASDGILLLDADAVIRVWSPALEELTGLSSDDAVGRPVSDVLTADRRVTSDPDDPTWLIQPASETEATRRVHARWRSPDGTSRDVQEEHAVVVEERAGVVGAVVIARDVTREAEYERLRADFVARVSHELRTPLTPIRGYVQLLLQRGERLDDEQRTDALRSVLARTDRLAELVEDLLLVTQLERGHLDGIVIAEPVALSGLLHEVVADQQGRAPGRRIELEEGADDLTAFADPRRLRQVVGALLDNAVRYGPDDRPVEVSLSQETDRLTIRVRDHGQGIPAAQRDQVFERFQRLEDPLTMRTGGVGLGLFIARRLTEAMGGRLDLEDASPGRCVFAVTLPAGAQAATAQLR